MFRSYTRASLGSATVDQPLAACHWLYTTMYIAGRTEDALGGTASLRGSRFIGYAYIRRSRLFQLPRQTFVIKYLTTKTLQFYHWHIAPVNPRIVSKEPVLSSHTTKSPNFRQPSLKCRSDSHVKQEPRSTFHHNSQSSFISITHPMSFSPSKSHAPSKPYRIQPRPL